MTPARYAAVYAALLALLGATIGVAALDLGRWNLILALAIAGIKAALVLWFFMHLKERDDAVWVFAGAGFAWLALLLTLSFSDYLTRLPFGP